jgi:CTP:molybdopterin cytidylyltransferase MocA
MICLKNRQRRLAAQAWIGKPGLPRYPRRMGKIVALIVAAGQGTRIGGTVPKQFAPLAGKPMLAHSFAALSSHPAIDTVVVVIGEGQEGRSGSRARPRSPS